MKNIKCLVVLLLVTLSASAQFTQKALPYAYNALEPFVDAQTMEIHYSKHHAAYVKNLNAALVGTAAEKLSLNEIFAKVSTMPAAVRNNAGGHYNHSLFWEILAPKDKQSTIQASFEAAVLAQYGSMDSLKKAITQAASTRFGSGWAWLIVTPDKKLMVTSTGNQDNPIMDVTKDRGIPVLGIDVWEHAYYLKYQNKRADYLGGIFNLIDWGIVSEKYNKALVDPLLSEIEKDNWLALKDFHKVMAQTYHPAEEGNFVPLRTRSGELLAKAILFANSKPPLSKDKTEVHKALTNLAEQCDKIYELTAKNAKDVERLLTICAKYLPEQAWWYDPDELTDRSEKFLASEMVREKLFRLTGDELPYTSTVVIDKFEEEAGRTAKRMLRIAATIVVEREGHKAMVIGDKGEKLKRIGTETRMELEKLLDAKVFIELWVKVRSGWADDEARVRSFGYE